MYTKKQYHHSSQAINLIKKFDTFEEAYTELIKFIPEVKTYCGETAMHDSVITAMMETISENIPSSSNPNFPYLFSFSIDAHEVGFKTDGDLAFGWREVFDRESATIKYKFRVTFISASTFRKTIIENMKQNDWAELEIKKQSRFWNQVAGNGKSNRFDKKRNNKNTTATTETEKYSTASCESTCREYTAADVAANTQIKGEVTPVEKDNSTQILTHEETVGTTGEQAEVNEELKEKFEAAAEEASAKNE